MIIIRQRNYSRPKLPLDLNTNNCVYNSAVDKMETTDEDIKYANRLLDKYKQNANPNSKNFRVKDMETGEWRKGTKEDVKRIISPEALSQAHKGYIYESKLNRLNNSEK